MDGVIFKKAHLLHSQQNAYFVQYIANTQFHIISI